jgi:hypothetical protein
MTSPSGFTQPPRIANRLVDLFAPAAEAESILGDLLEEFSDLVSKSGVAVARRWYWRQTAKTIAHLCGAVFRDAPWSTAAFIVAGFLLHGFVSGLPDKMLSAATDRYLGYWSAHFRIYMFFATDGMLVAHLVASMFVGCIVALAAKGREMVSTMTLGLIIFAMTVVAFVWVATHQPMDDTLPWLLWSGSGPCAIIVGGVIVRMRRAGTVSPPSRA